jgi:predicted nucleic acid-binding protein
MRCVLDANVAISALLFEHSKPGQAFRLVLEQHVILISLRAD